MDHMRIGDLRTELARDLRQQLEKVINKNKRKSRYYILATAHQIERGVVETKLVLTRQKPPKMLGTICWHVDNRKGYLQRLWVLPWDIPRPAETISDEPVSKQHPEIESTDQGIIESAQDVPIIH